MIQLIQGSIFDSKCDLLIVPCDSEGGVTPAVFSNLADHGLPTSVGSIPYGTIFFHEGFYEFANTVGYAASVDVETITSAHEAIVSIASQVVRYAVSNDASTINLPLLGSGAGGMTPIDSYLALREGLTSEEVLFNIFCISRTVYQNIVSVEKPVQKDDVPKSPRVFISYTGNNPANAEWARTLARALLRNGVKARIDAFHLKPGSDLPQWMTNEVIMADKVLLICDKHYMEKADFRQGGVGWETMVIQGDMLTQGDNKNKYIAITREAAIDEALPIYMKSKYALNWGNSQDIDEDHLKKLVLLLFDCDEEPDLGPVPPYVLDRYRQSGK